eukprot:TRINITY_DN4286_c2_g2_i1.p1 TRINITY_DN4286_c2_g2~~TRINITY_DN4286_c2_g2_i1.p1  ORF type:complete len:293 (+),score=34.68 TRINITY_DN4286_c2_g2_i1:49-879(+)
MVTPIALNSRRSANATEICQQPFAIRIGPKEAKHELKLGLRKRGRWEWWQGDAPSQEEATGVPQGHWAPYDEDVSLELEVQWLSNLDFAEGRAAVPAAPGFMVQRVTEDRPFDYCGQPSETEFLVKDIITLDYPVYSKAEIKRESCYVQFRENDPHRRRPVRRVGAKQLEGYAKQLEADKIGQTIMDGLLEKLGGIECLKRWQKRTVRVQADAIRYSDPGPWRPREKQCIPLASIKDVKTEGSEFIVLGIKPYRFRTADAEECSRWVDAIRQARET